MAVSFEEGVLKKALMIFWGKPAIHVFLVATQLAVLFFRSAYDYRLTGCLTFHFFFVYYLLQVFKTGPFKGRLLVLESHLLNKADGFEDVDDII